MKKMILRAVLLLLAVLAVPLALLITAFAIPAQFSKTYYGELPAMYDRLRDAEGHKIVLVGSSGLAFGVNPDLLDAEFPDYTVCPFGLYGTIGTKTMMDLSKAHISEGDLVILAPEQGAQTYSMYFNGGEVWLATDGRPDIAARLPFGEYANMAESLPAFLARKYRCFTVDGAPEPSGVYAKSSFNESCALIYDRPYNIMDGGFNPQDPISYDPGIAEEAFLDYVNEYNDWVTKKGATLLFAFPPVNKAAIEGGLDEAAVRRFYDFLDEELECPLLGNPLDSVMEAEWFYDSNVHLNTPGSVAFTKTLAETLKAYLGDTSPVHIDVPDMPPLPGRDPAEGGEDADAAYFTYEETDGGLRITGLTAEGRTRTALTIPAQYNGQPVTGFLADTFAGNTVIEEIRFQSNIRTVQDGSFSGCTALSAVYLAPGEDPSHCQVPPGGGLTEGADALYFYVERARLADYIYNYFWSAYGARIRAYDPVTPGPGPDPSGETPGTDPTAPTEPGSSGTPDPSDPPEGPGDDTEIGQNQALVRYYLNGGTLSEDSPFRASSANAAGHFDVLCSTALLPRINTAVPAGTLTKPGFTQTGWNTEADGSGTHTGIGSRVTLESGAVSALYAEWTAWSPAEDFSYVLIDPEDLPRLYADAPKIAALEDLAKPEGSAGSGAVVTGYTGENTDVVIPGTLGGYPVIGVAAGAFRETALTSVVFPDTVLWVANRIGTDSGALREVTLFDNILRIEQDPFGTGVTPATVRINAYLPPVYGISENGQFVNKMEFLMHSSPDRRKLVLFGGCSVWYGVDTGLLQDRYKGFEILNMGIIGGLSGQLQLDLIEPYLHTGDILIHIPELTEFQLLCTNHVDSRLFELTEGNYDLLTRVDLREYRFFFQGFRDFVAAKHTLLDNHVEECSEYVLLPDFMDVHGNLLKDRGPEYDSGNEPFALIDPDYFTEEGIVLYYSRLAAKGVQLYWACGPLEKNSVDVDTGLKIQNMVFTAIRKAELPVEILLELPEVLMDALHFYDTSYHLNSSGAIEYTSLLLNKLPMKFKDLTEE